MEADTQSLNVSGEVRGGTFTLTFNGFTTRAIPADPTEIEINDAIRECHEKSICSICNRYRADVDPQWVNPIIGVLLSVVTLGVFIPFWVNREKRCPECGNRNRKNVPLGDRDSPPVAKKIGNEFGISYP